MKLGNYRGLKVKRPDLTVSDKALARALHNLQTENGVLVHVDGRPAQEGDRAVLDMTGVIDGKAFPGSRRSHYTLILGDHAFLPDFDEKIIGHNAGDFFEIEEVYPEDYPMHETAGKTAHFSIILLSFGILELQEVDDDFARDFSDYDTKEELIRALRGSLLEDQEEREASRVEQELLTQLIDSSELQLDEEILQNLQKEYESEFEDRLAEQSLTMEEFLSRTGKTRSDVEDNCREEAVRTLSETMVLNAVAEAEGLSVSKKELKASLREMAEEYEMEYRKFVRSLGEDDIEGIRLEMLCGKAMELILNEAVYI